MLALGDTDIIHLSFTIGQLVVANAPSDEKLERNLIKIKDVNIDYRYESPVTYKIYDDALDC